MSLPSLPAAVGIAFFCSEIIISFKRSGATAAKKDRGSLRLLGIVIYASIFLGVYLRTHAPEGRMASPERIGIAGVAIFLAGLVIRWTSVLWLGRFFTVDVAIASDHTIVDTGPYKHLRHPSYTGGLLAFIGYGLTLGNWISFFVTVVPTICAFLWRMHIEEQALSEAFGEAYVAYMKRTKRLIPFVY